MKRSTTSDYYHQRQPTIIEAAGLGEFKSGNGDNTSNLMFEGLAPQSFGDYLMDTDTDTENSSLPSTRRWVWYCRLPVCPGYYSAWSCKSNFLLHLYETPAHQQDATTKTHEGRRQLARAWKEETAFDLSEPKKKPPELDINGNKFEYSLLDGPRTIRLVQLHQEMNGFGSPIMCSIHHKSLDDQGLQYRALSYCWGDSENLSTIGMDGKTFHATKNLENALRRLRTNRLCCCNLVCSCSDNRWYPETIEKCFNSPSFLWIDALCINQNGDEKNEQVALMKDIYQQADEVIVWLGEESGDTVPALRLLYGLAEVWPRDEAKALISHVVKNELFRSYWSALGHFLGRPSWSRVWIVQEIIMAQKAIVVCGRWCADWDIISKAIVAFHDCLDFMDEIIEANISDQPKEFQTFRRNAAFLVDLQPPSNPADIKAILQLSKNRFSTDPLDKIYAFLGILEEFAERNVLQPDYTISPCELYMQVCRALCEETKSLDFLSMRERNRDHNQNQHFELPSWSPDWTVPTKLDPLFRDGSHPPPWSAANPKSRALSEKFFFTGNSTPRCAFDLISKKLVVTGFVVDTIGAIQCRFKDLLPDISFPGSPTYGKRICWRQSSPAEEFECNSFWLTRLKPVYALEKPIECAGEKLKEETQKDYRLDILTFTTETHHYIGVTDAAIQPRDSICALLGGKLPYIIRNWRDSYIFVGQCVLVKMMNGEVMEGLSKGTFALREFVLV